AGGAAWAARLGAVCAAVALGLYGVLQAVGRGALQQAGDAWARAPAAGKAARLARGEAIPGVGGGAPRFSSVPLGLALILPGSAVAVTARLPRALGYLMGLSGLAYIVQRWVLGSEGFAGTGTFAILGGYVLILAWIIWLAVAAWQAKEPLTAPAR